MLISVRSGRIVTRSANAVAAAAVRPASRATSATRSGGEGCASRAVIRAAASAGRPSVKRMRCNICWSAMPPPRRLRRLNRPCASLICSAKLPPAISAGFCAIFAQPSLRLSDGSAAIMSRRKVTMALASPAAIRACACAASLNLWLRAIDMSDRLTIENTTVEVSARMTSTLIRTTPCCGSRAAGGLAKRVMAPPATGRCGAVAGLVQQG